MKTLKVILENLLEELESKRDLLGTEKDDYNILLEEDIKKRLWLLKLSEKYPFLGIDTSKPTYAQVKIRKYVTIKRTTGEEPYYPKLKHSEKRHEPEDLIEIHFPSKRFLISEKVVDWNLFMNEETVKRIDRNLKNFIKKIKKDYPPKYIYGLTFYYPVEDSEKILHDLTKVISRYKVTREKYMSFKKKNDLFRFANN